MVYTWQELVDAMPDITRQKYFHNLYIQNKPNQIEDITLGKYTNYGGMLSGSFVFKSTIEGGDYSDKVIIFLDEVVLPNVGKVKLDLPRITFDFLHN